MFPYPSGKFTWDMSEIIQSDVLARYKKLKGFNILHPMGWDFRMPAENAAKQNDLDPKKWTELNIQTMKKQLMRLVYQSIGIEKYQLVLRTIINISNFSF